MGRCEAEVDTFSSVKIHLPPSLAPLPLAHLQLHPTEPKFTSGLRAFSHSYVIDLSYRGNLKIIFTQLASFDLIYRGLLAKLFSSSIPAWYHTNPHSHPQILYMSTHTQTYTSSLNITAVWNPALA